MLVLAVDGIDGENGVLANVGMSVFKAGTTRWNERFQEFRVLGDFLEETKCSTSNILVWMLLYYILGEVWGKMR